MINKTDLAPAVGADLAVMERDALRMREGGPFVFAQVQDQAVHIFIYLFIFCSSQELMLVASNMVYMLIQKFFTETMDEGIFLPRAGETRSGCGGYRESYSASVGNCNRE